MNQLPKKRKVPPPDVLLIDEEHLLYTRGTQGLHSRNKDSADAIEVISNELGVLLSRGIRGVYLYATDPKLRGALIQAVK